MLLHILKIGQPKRLLMLALWMILSLGLLFDKATGLKCYKCEGPECKTNFGKVENEVDCEHGYCETVIEGDTVKRQCSPSVKEGECISKEFPWHCYTFSDGDKTKLSSCMTKDSNADGEGGTAAWGEDRFEKPGIQICACNSALCNNGGESSGNIAKNAIARSIETPSSDEGNAVSRQSGEQYIRCFNCGHDEANSVNCSLPIDQLKKCTSNTQYCVKLVHLETGQIEKSCVYKQSRFSIACFNKHGIAGCVEPDNKAAYDCHNKQNQQSSKQKWCLCRGNLCNFGGQLNSEKVLIYLFAMLCFTLQLLRIEDFSVSF